jgi:hypothetical protein
MLDLIGHAAVVTSNGENVNLWELSPTGIHEVCITKDTVLACVFFLISSDAYDFSANKRLQFFSAKMPPRTPPAGLIPSSAARAPPSPFLHR